MEISKDNLRLLFLSDLNLAHHYLQEHGKNGDEEMYYKALKAIDVIIESLILLHHGIISPEIKKRYNLK
jgi:hypothetical protein